MKRACVLILGLVLLAGPDSAPAQNAKSGSAEAAIKVVVLEVRKPTPPAENDIAMAYGSGTVIGVQLAQPDRNILAIDRTASKLTQFADDKGTDLSKGTGYVPAWLESYMVRISKDRHRCAARLQAPSIPAVGATKILLKASLVLQCGSAEKAVEHKDLDLTPSPDKKDKPDAKTVAVGPFSLRVEKGFGAGPMIRISSDDPIVKEITFVGADGKPLKGFLSGLNMGVTNTRGKAEYISTYSFNEKVTRATVKLTYYENIEKVTVPVDLEIGVGF
jgi:hypothetical protein